jgi:hypothetical protein
VPTVIRWYLNFVEAVGVSAVEGLVEEEEQAGVP